MTVEENLSFPLTIQKMPKADQKAKIDDVLEIVGLTDKKRLIREIFPVDSSNVWLWQELLSHVRKFYF